MINFNLPPDHDNVRFTPDAKEALIDPKYSTYDIGTFVGSTLLRHTDRFNVIKIAAALQCHADALGANGFEFRIGVHNAADRKLALERTQEVAL